MENLGMSKDKLELLQQFVQLCKLQPGILHNDNLKFFKDWIVHDLKATIPGEPDQEEQPKEQGDSPGGSKTAWTKDKSSSESESSEEESDDVESSDLDIDMEGTVSGDTDPPQEMGDDEKVSTEEEQDKAMDMRSLGMQALQNGDNEGAAKHFTAGILLDNKKTVLFVKRATAYLRLSKPNAAMRDAQKALTINPDSAAAYKVLGKANKLLGNWDEACHDFEESQKLDYDDEIKDLLKEIKPKATKIREHRMAKERKLKEKDLAARLKRAKKIKKAQEKARKEQEKRDQESMKGGMPFNFANMPDMAGFDFAKAQEQFAKSQEQKQQQQQQQSKPEENGESKNDEVPTDIDLD